MQFVKHQIGSVQTGVFALLNNGGDRCVFYDCVKRVLGFVPSVVLVGNARKARYFVYTCREGGSLEEILSPSFYQYVY